LKGPEKQWEAPIAKASVVAIANEAKRQTREIHIAKTVRAKKSTSG